MDRAESAKGDLQHKAAEKRCRFFYLDERILVIESYDRQSAQRS